MEDKATLYVGLDTQGTEWNLVCGVSEQVWSGSTQCHDSVGFEHTLKAVAKQCGLSDTEFNTIVLFEDIPWEEPLIDFFHELPVAALILDPHSVPLDLCGALDDEGFCNASTLFNMLMRKFVQKEDSALKTLEVNHGFLDEINIMNRERKQLRKEYGRHLAYLKMLVTDSGHHLPSDIENSPFSSLKPIKVERFSIAPSRPPNYLLARLERHRQRMELVVDQEMVVDDDFFDYYDTHLKAAPQQHIHIAEEPFKVIKADPKQANMPSEKTQFEKTPTEVLVTSLKKECRKLRKEKSQLRGQLISWVTRLGGDLTEVDMVDPSTLRSHDGQRHSRALIMLLLRAQERLEFASEQYEDLWGLVQRIRR